MLGGIGGGSTGVPGERVWEPGRLDDRAKGRSFPHGGVSFIGTL